MTTTTMTIFDPDGEPYELEWYDQFDSDVWCMFCDEIITAGWLSYHGNYWLLIVCDACATANATTEGR